MEEKHIALSLQEKARREKIKNAMWCKSDSGCTKCGGDSECLSAMHFDFFSKEEWDLYAWLSMKK